VGAAAAGTADTSLDQDAAHRGAAQVDTLPLSEQLGEVAAVCPGVAVAGQLDHGSGGHLGDSVVGPSPPVPVGQCGGTMPAVSSEEALGVAFTHSHDLGSLGYGKLVFQNGVEHLNPGLFLLIQLYIPHEDDIVADQLAGDRIVDHQQIFRFNGSKFLAIYTKARLSAGMPVPALDSVKTVEVVGRMTCWDGEYLLVSGDRDKRERTNMALTSMFRRHDESDDDPEYQAWLAPLPDIQDGDH